MGQALPEKPAGGMAWAVDSQEKTPVYIGSLTRKQMGLRCGCICPACDARLQAVNAGLDARGGRVPFFRHHLVQQGAGCKFRVAELAALKLLAERGLIEIPAPRQKSTYVGVSGRIYSFEQVGKAVSEAIVERRLVSAAQVILTLESGRKVALVLRGFQNVGEFGDVFAVIEVEVNDPEVAWMSTDEIVARSELTGQWLHLAHHDDDARLRQQADDEVRRQALEKLDIDPVDLGLPAGATKKQVSESVLHWAIKSALRAMGTLVAPEFRDTVSAVEKDGSVHTVGVVVPSTRLTITDVVDEVLFDGYRPDIVCIARAANGNLGKFRLLVEVAVTSKVAAVKLGRIIRDDVACIELDAAQFTQGGQVSLTELQDLVANDLRCKTWLHHPVIWQLLVDAREAANGARDLAEAKKAAATKQARILEEVQLNQRAREEREKMRKRDWAKSLNQSQALRELRLVLERRWAAELQISSNGMVWDGDEFESAISRVVSPLQLGRHITSRGGIAWRLSRIVCVARDRIEPLDFFGITGPLGEFGQWEMESWLGLIHLAIENLRPEIDIEGSEAFVERRQLVVDSLQAGKRTFVRPPTFDATLVIMFPELERLMSQELGTEAYCQRLVHERKAAEHAAQEAAELAAVARANVKAQLDAAAAIERERQRLPEAIAAAAFEMVWRQNLKIPPSPDAAIKTLAIMGIKSPSSSIQSLVKDGWAARRDGRGWSDWFNSQLFESVEEVHSARAALDAAFLIEPRFRRPR